MDIWVDRTESNYFKLAMAFEEFKMPVFDMTINNFLTSTTLDVFKFGRKPVFIDIMTKMKGLEFQEAYDSSEIIEMDGLRIKTLHLNDLIKAKRASGRFKGLNDIEQLMK